MNKFAIIVTITVASVSAVAAQDLTGDMANGKDDTRLSPPIAQRIAELRQYGDRFENAIRLIEAEAAKPKWGWEGPDRIDETATVILPER